MGKGRRSQSIRWRKPTVVDRSVRIEDRINPLLSTMHGNGKSMAFAMRFDDFAVSSSVDGDGPRIIYRHGTMAATMTSDARS